jgi:hypothetical protein
MFILINVFNIIKSFTEYFIFSILISFLLKDKSCLCSSDGGILFCEDKVELLTNNFKKQNIILFAYIDITDLNSHYFLSQVRIN